MTEQTEKWFNAMEDALQARDVVYERTRTGALYKTTQGGAVTELVEPGQQIPETAPEGDMASAGYEMPGLDASAAWSYMMDKAEQTEPEMQETITVEQMAATPEIVSDAMKMYELFEDKPFQGTADELIDYAVNVQADFMFNIAGIPGAGTDAGGAIAQAAYILGKQDPEKAEAFLNFMAQYEKLPTFTSAGVSRAFRSIFTDPTTYAGIASAGAGLFGRKVAQEGAKVGIKQALRQLARPAEFAAKRPIAASALAGAGYSEVGELTKMAAETGAGQAPSALEAGIRGTVAPIVGATAGAGIAKGGQIAGQAVGEIAAPLLDMAGNVIEAAGEQAKKQLNEGGTKLMSGPDLDTPINKAVAAAGDAVKSLRAQEMADPNAIQLSDAERAGTLIDELYGEGTIEPGGNLYDVAKKLNDKSKSIADRSAPTPENKTAIAKMMAAEVLHAMRAKGNAADWYKTKIENAMKIASRIFPELATSEEDAHAFKFIMAITSNGADVATNSVDTVRVYSEYRKNKVMPIVGFGREKPSMEFAFSLFNNLEKELGSKAAVFDLFNKNLPVREIKEIGKKYGFTVSGEKQDTVLPVSVIFGPKIGGAFLPNLEGDFRFVTMDRWFMRMWGRMSGTLIPEKSIATLTKQQQRARDATTPELASKYGFVYDDIINDDTVLSDFANVVHKKFASGGFKDKTEFTRSMKALDEGSTKVLETPGGGGHRAFMRETVEEATEMLRQMGFDTDPASVQALLWYPEKELYGKLGVGNKKSKPTDYETELRKIAEERGIDVSDIK